MTALDEIKIGGLGASRRRVEDNRFIRGKGRYVDDVVLPGMLHMEILRSPLAHARIRSIDATKAWSIPGVRMVLTGEMMAKRNLAWMPTLSYDTQAVLATDKVRFQGQEVACVIADDPYIAKDGCEAIVVDYEPLPVIVNPDQALAEGAPLVRDDKENQHDNVVFDWEVGDKAGTDRAFEQADVISKLELHYPRSHPSPIECCGSVADFDRATQKLTVYMTTQAPHIIRAAVALVAELPEHMIRIVSPDIGGGFGNKVPVYPGYVCSILASILLEKPVKWIEDKTGNLISTGFARDIYLEGEMALRKDGKILGVRMHTTSDHGAFFSDAQPSKFKIGLMHSAFACYDIPAAHLTARGVYTNKAPGGVAYACSFRITEAVYLIERLVDCLAYELDIDPVALRLRNLLRPEQFPYTTSTGWTYDSGNYEATLREALRIADYDGLRREQAEKRARGELMGIGVSCFTEAVGAGPRRDMDIMGLGMSDGAELRVHPTGTAVLRVSCQTQGQGHETTFAQIVAEEIGIAPADIRVVHGDTDQTPFGLGTYGSRSTSVSGAAAVVVARRVRDKAMLIASAMLEISVTDLVWDKGRIHVVGDPNSFVTIKDVAAWAYGPGELPDGVEGALGAEVHYDPASLTYPNGAYICVVDVDPGTAVVTVRRFVAVDDCGTRINPMIIEGQVHRGLTDGVGMALMEMIAFDDAGNCLGASLMDYLLPSSLEVPSWETGFTVTPSPHHPIGAKGVGESATVGSPPAVVNAVLDALRPYGLRHVDMPLTPSRLWHAMTGEPEP